MRKPAFSRSAALLGAAAVCALAIGGCSTLSKVADLNPFQGGSKPSTISAGARIPVVAQDDRLEVSDTLRGVPFQLPAETPRTDWPLPGGELSQSVENVQAAPQFAVAWRRALGAASSRSRHVTAPPIIAAGRIFVMDGAADVSAHDLATGAQIWRVNIMPKSKRDKEGWGGGLAYSEGKLYVTSGFRQVVQLDASTGAMGWRVRTEAPVHAAPTVSNGKVFFEDVTDEFFALDTNNGQQLWTYQALTEPARMLVSTSPATNGETLVASFASGELVALRAANGNELWNVALSKASRTNALSEIRDIAGRPVIYQGDVYAVSHSNVFAAVDLRAGQVRWALPVSAITSPLPAGDVVYVVDVSGRVICASRENGQIYWIRELNVPPVEPRKGHKQSKPKKTPNSRWSSPLLASGRLVMVSSDGQAVALNAHSGEIEHRLKLGADSLIAPIAANGMVYVVTQTAQLIAIR
jgi:outer membrane protein assembly factor BamB